jgi:hypothetical protein
LAAAVIVAVPADTALTVMDEPVFALKVTIPVGITDQFTVLSVAFDGWTLAFIVRVLPTAMEEFPEGEDSEILVTNCWFTVTETVSVLSTPPMAVAVITACPTAIPVTVIEEPVSELRLTIPAGLTVQRTVESVACPGKTVVFMVKLSPG